MRNALILTVVALALLERPSVGADWSLTVEVPRPERKGKPQSPSQAHLWIPEDAKTLRGLIVAGRIRLEKGICTSALIRKVCAEERLGILYYEPHFSGIFDTAHSNCEELFLASLAHLARESGHAELELVPWLTIGHSTGGIFARNVAYWKPERVIGIIHLKSGNFQDHVQDPSRSLAGVPLLAVNGEFEEYGPAGGDLKGGKRSRYSLHPTDKARQNQTQWVMIRMQMIERRRRNPDNLMSLVVHRGGSHTDWSDELMEITAQFIHSAARARVPVGEPDGDGRVVRCRRLSVEDGWLSDADIKAPRHEPAPFAEYTGDRTLAFWHLDKAMARAIEAYHEGPWSHKDPTEGLSPGERYVPPEVLEDRVDLE